MKRRLRILLLVLYLIILFIFVVIKFYGNINDLIDRVHIIQADRNEGIWNINLTTLVVLRRYLRVMKADLLHGTIINSYAIQNIIGNIIPFIPFGLLIPLNFKKMNNFLRFFIASSLFIIGIEFFQFITLLGYCDIQDYILNIIGCSFGYALYKLTSIAVLKVVKEGKKD